MKSSRASTAPDPCERRSVLICGVGQDPWFWVANETVSIVDRHRGITDIRLLRARISAPCSGTVMSSIGVAYTGMVLSTYCKKGW